MPAIYTQHSSLPRRAMVLVVSIVLTALLLSAVSIAQEDQAFTASADKFACNGGADFPPVDDQYHGMSLVLLESAPKDLSAAVKPRSFGPFKTGPSRPDAMSVEFYQFLSGGEPSMATETELHLYVRVLTAKGNRWYELQSHDFTGLKADPGPGDSVAGDSASDEQPGNQKAAALRRASLRSLQQVRPGARRRVVSPAGRSELPRRD